MRIKEILPLIASAAIVVTFPLAAAAAPAGSHAFPGHQFLKSAKITLADARGIALKARPGVITDQELEREKGGSGLRYSFDIKSDSAVYEVGVDAKTGTVLEDAKEGAHPD